MAEEVKKEEVKAEEPKKEGILGKIKEFSEDKEEQMEIFSTFVRLGILIWSGGILTLNYVSIPNFPQKNIDPTFIASVFTGVLATFGIETAKKRGDGTMKVGGGSGPGGAVSKQDMEKLIEKATQAAPAQTIRIEQAPLVLSPTPPAPKKDDKA